MRTQQRLGSAQHRSRAKHQQRSTRECSQAVTHCPHTRTLFADTRDKSAPNSTDASFPLNDCKPAKVEERTRQRPRRFCSHPDTSPASGARPKCRPCHPLLTTDVRIAQSTNKFRYCHSVPLPDHAANSQKAIHFSRPLALPRERQLRPRCVRRQIFGVIPNARNGSTSTRKCIVVIGRVASHRFTMPFKHVARIVFPFALSNVNFVCGIHFSCNARPSHARVAVAPAMI